MDHSESRTGHSSEKRTKICVFLYAAYQQKLIQPAYQQKVYDYFVSKINSFHSS